jgi:hypothetical protein
MKEEYRQHVIAARHVCQEARVVLTSLRGGPPHVARGDLAQDLMDLREFVPRKLEEDEQKRTLSDALKSAGAGPFDEVGGEHRRDTLLGGTPTPTNTVTSPDMKMGGPFARPFLQVVVDPRAAGPHTLVALRAIYRLLKRGTYAVFQVQLQPIMQHVLACKFEQTDPGADEAVEMAIADVILLLVQLNDDHIPPQLLMDACNTVFMTRNTFVHSSALCYHFEDVLTSMVTTLFSRPEKPIAKFVFEFLVNQLLHTPLVGGDGLDESTRDAAEAHDANRILCLRLVRTALSVGWADDDDNNNNNSSTPAETTFHQEKPNDRTLLNIIQDDLCLSLLMTGQAIWAYHDAHTNISPGFVSLAVLTEICATISLLWNSLTLRPHLVSQFETIFTGFYTRALVLLRKRRPPTNSMSFNGNLIFDSEVEIILESLVDILTLHDHKSSIADGDGGALETIFAHYDCHMRRSDVAMGLIVELCRCCGGTVDEEGEAALTPSNSAIFTKTNGNGQTTTPCSTPVESIQTVDVEPLAPKLGGGAQPRRHVPAHLKELCAQAIMGAMKCLFRDDQASAETMVERSKRKRSILLRQVPPGITVSDNPTDEVAQSAHWLRDLKSKKRLMRRAAQIFNKKPSRGISFLLDSGLVAEPVTPKAVAIFLRNGIVVGLDKKEVGAYLGEAGKSPVAGKSPPNWERDWFHKEVLQIFCSLFRFENQSLLDGLRMFLAAFRLPGEAQQIDRILQAFSDSCGQVCEESSGRKLFSEDPKRASDCAYLLSFSIIMLNTDQHNNNIREDRKMNCDDFVKNNTDYGRDITEKGKELPREYLAGIFASIREEEFRTEGEGADGAMTVERWKDVMRGSTVDDAAEEDGFHPSRHDVEDLTELVLEHAWKPIVSAIGALWGATFSRYVDRLSGSSQQSRSGMIENAAHSGMLGVQGARLGMDMAVEMMNGVRQLGRIDIFRKIFTCVCDYTGLVGDYTEDSVERTWVLSNSVESQSAVVVAFRIASEASEELDEDGWRQIWSILFEMRDLKLIARGKPGINASIFHESDADLLTEYARSQWNMCIVKGDMEFEVAPAQADRSSGAGSVLGAIGRVLWGTDDPVYPDVNGQEHIVEVPSPHGKEELVVWDEGAPSDDESDTGESTENSDLPVSRSPGAQFEHQLIRESTDLSRLMDMPVTGLERVEDTRRYQISPRARVRDRFRRMCSFATLVADSRFMEEEGIRSLLLSLVAMVSDSDSPPTSPPPSGPVGSTPRIPAPKSFERSVSDVSSIGSNFSALLWQTPLSPASEAFAEVLICEIALKNKDRLKELWADVLQNHYLSKLTRILVNPAEGSAAAKIPVDPGLEKRVTGLIRLSIYGMQRKDLANEILSSWKYLLPMNAEQHATSPLRALDRHMGEGLWRMVAQVDDLLNLEEDGWEGLISFFNWCAMRGSSLKPIRSRDGGSSSALPEDDVALQCYRSLHLILNTKELEKKVPYYVADSIRILVSAGERRNYPQLSIATLDLLGIFFEKKIAFIDGMSAADATKFWASCWRKIVEGFAEASERSSDAVRCHFCSFRDRVVFRH